MAKQTGEPESFLEESVDIQIDHSAGQSGKVFEFWQAPDRDSPAGQAIDLNFTLEVSNESNSSLKALLQLDGINAYDDEEVQKRTGIKVSRARRWSKFFERMGIMYREEQVSRLTPFGKTLSTIADQQKADFRYSLADLAISTLQRYQLKNPADELDGHYPEDCNVFPYWCIWKAADALDGRLHWDELNRELMRVLRIQDLDARIDKIRIARRDPSYNPSAGGSKDHPLSPRCYEELKPPKRKTADGQVRDHYMTPWLKKAGFGGLLLVTPGKAGEGYWTISEDIRSRIKLALEQPPRFRTFKTKQDWFEHYGSLRGDQDPIDEDMSLSPDDPVWKQTEDLLRAGSLTIILTGPPGTSKTWYARRLAYKIAGANSRVSQVQFHPSFSYDDFIEGYVPMVPQSGQSQTALFQIVPKIFLTFCDQARKTPEQKFVLVVDEINRGDVSRIFGELITYLEPSYREKTFTLAYSGRKTTIPKNVILLGTMNPFDRSITELDDALDRRFDRLPFDPDLDQLKTILIKAETPGVLVGKIIEFFTRANNLTPHGVGHAFFTNAKTEADLVRIWNHNLRFVFQKTFRFDPEKLQEIREAYEALISDATLLH